jgi:glyoxylase-like metal-dependent hydrolase (beta-lactamase superfamily II)
MTITWTHFPAGEAGFFRAPVLLTGPHEALLIDGGFTLDDGRAVARAIAATGKRLTAVYVSQSDPDYYFSLAPIRAAFSEARIVAAPATVAAIEANVQKKLDVWSPKLGANGPRTRADVVIPTPSDERTLWLDGEAIEIIEADGLANRRTLWLPSLRAVFGGVLVFAGVHVWTADSPTLDQRAAWRANLDALAARGPAVVVPGHAAAGAATEASAIAYTRDYLTAFDQEVARAAGSAGVIAAMKARYPDAGMAVALDIGAKVATGEMTWG